MRSRAIFPLLLVLGVLMSCGAEEPLVAVADQIDVDVGGVVEFDPRANDLAPLGSRVVVDRVPGLSVAVTPGNQLVVENESVRAGATVEVPYRLEINERVSQSFVNVKVPGDSERSPVVLPETIEFDKVVIDAEGLVQNRPIFVANLSPDETMRVELELMGPAFELTECPVDEQNCVGGVRFRPRGAGEWAGAVAVELDGELLGTVGLSGAAIRREDPAPAKIFSFDAAPNPIQLGRRVRGGEELSGSIKVSNTGNQDLNLSATAGSDEVRVKSRCGPLLAPGESCGVDVFVSTGVVRSISADVVLSAPSARRQVVTVQAVVVAPVNRPVLAADRKTVGLSLANPTETVVVENLGPGTVRGISVLPAGLYAIAGVTCDGALGVGDSCQFDVSLTEDAVAVGGQVALAGVSVLADNSDGVEVTVSADTSVPPEPAITVSPTSIRFLDNNEPRDVTVTNTGSVTVGNLRITENGDNGALGPFRITSIGTCARDLEPGRSCTFSFQLETLPPGFIGLRVEDVVRVTSGGASAPIAVAIGVVLR